MFFCNFSGKFLISKFSKFLRLKLIFLVCDANLYNAFSSFFNKKYKHFLSKPLISPI